MNTINPALTKASTTQANTDLIKTSEDLNKFLTLLTAQVKNQDPFKPIDATQFVDQLATLSSVEQQVKTNQKMDSLVQQVNSQSMNYSLSYLGKMVAVPSDHLTFQGSPVAFDFINSNAEAQKVKIEIVDDLGNLVYKEESVVKQGLNNFNWDGRDLSGNPVSNGTYHFKIDLFDQVNKPLDSVKEVFVDKRISELLFSNEGIVFTTDDGERVSIADIYKIKA